MSVNIHCNFRR